MTKIFLTLITLFLSMGFSISAFAHTGLSHASIIHSLLHTVITISIVLSLFVAGFVVFKRLPKANKQRFKK